MDNEPNIVPYRSRKAGYTRFFVRLPSGDWLRSASGKRRSFAAEAKAADALFSAEDAARDARVAEAQCWGRNVAQDAIDLGEREDFSGYLENLSDAMRDHLKDFSGVDFDRACDAFKARLAEAGIDPALV